MRAIVSLVDCIIVGLLGDKFRRGRDSRYVELLASEVTVSSFSADEPSEFFVVEK